MKEMPFLKIVASGNDFILMEAAVLGAAGSGSLGRLARLACDRKFGIGADGLLVMGKVAGAGLSMRIFNADGSEAEMCGNGARCAAFWGSLKLKVSRLKIKTRAGMISAQSGGSSVRVRLTDPRGMKLDLPLKVGGRQIKVNFINTGVPHAVIFAEGLDKIDVAALGRQVRYHRRFAPAGANVNLVEALNADSIRVRTYERGVEDETLACGTGACASALAFALKSGSSSGRINVHTRGGEMLKVYFQRDGSIFSDVWLEGRVKIICKGVYYV